MSAAPEAFNDPPPPGSDEALALGCRCPVLDNGRGRGYRGMQGIYVFNSSCPVHHPVPESASHEGRGPAGRGAG